MARLIAHNAAQLLEGGLEAAPLLERVRDHVLAHVRLLAAAMSVETGRGRGPGAATTFERTVADYFLCTAVGVLVDTRYMTTFSLGDGLFVVNGERHRLGPFADNQPPYLAYQLLGTGTSGRAFEIERTLSVDDVRSLVIATDGVHDLDCIAREGTGPNDELQDPLRPFWDDDRIFRNPDMVRRRLTLIKRRSAGRMGDDTTLIVLRRSQERPR
jgi:hypothetical protein